jgi:sugar phosphate isomerase/epimerase
MIDGNGDAMDSGSMKRRSFLKAAASLPLAICLPWQVSAEKAKICGLAIGTYGLQTLSLEAAIDLVAGTGYNAIEITTFGGFTGDPQALDASKRRDLRKRASDQGLRICALMADLHPSVDDSKHAEQSEELMRLFALAHDLAETPPLVQTVLGGKSWEGEKNLFRDRLAGWMQIAADQRGTLSIKPHRGHAMSRPEDAIWLFEQLGKPKRVRMVYDFSHYALRQPAMTIADTVKVALPWTNYVAVKDAVEADGKVRFALAGESGNQDHAEIIRAFHAGGYGGDFCCEVSSQIWKSDPTYDAVAATKTCYQNMSAAFEKAGVARA